MTQQSPSPTGFRTVRSGSAFERSGALAYSVEATAVGWALLAWFFVLVAPSAVREGRDAVASGVPVDEVYTSYQLLDIPLAIVQIMAFMLAGTWLARARRNADRIVPHLQLRSKVWVWLGWILPVVHLWFPKQIVDDVWRSTVHHPRRPDTGWWWASWIAGMLLSFMAGGAFLGTVEDPGTPLEPHLVVEGLAALVTTIAALRWIHVVRTISRAQNALADGAPPPTWGHPWSPE